MNFFEGFFCKVIFLENRPKNIPKPVLVFWSILPCVFCLYTLLKVVGYYDFSVTCMSVTGFKKSLDGVGRWGELYPVLFWIF